MPNKFFRITASMFAIPIVIILLLATFKGDTQHDGGFNRNYLRHELRQERFINLGTKGYNIAGITASGIYLTKADDVHRLIFCSNNFSDTNHIYLNTHEFGIAHAGVRTSIDSPHIYQHESINSIFLAATIPAFKFNKYNLPIRHFINLFPVTPSSNIILQYDTAMHQTVFTKDSAGYLLDKYSYASKKEGDGIFSLDGKGVMNPSNRQLLYVYYYRNQFVALDSNLQLQFLANTIDTVTTAKTEVANVQSSRSFKLAAPPPFVNKEACIAGKYLYIYSVIKSDNHLKNSGCDIDIYNCENGKYIGSFLLPKQSGNDLSDFMIRNNQLYAIFGEEMICFRLDQLLHN